MKNFNLYVDRKSTVWEREYYNVEAENIQEATKKILDYDCDLDDSEILYETLEYMDVDENDGESTLEIFDDSDKLIYSNKNNV